MNIINKRKASLSIILFLIIMFMLSMAIGWYKIPNMDTLNAMQIIRRTIIFTFKSMIIISIYTLLVINNASKIIDFILNAHKIKRYQYPNYCAIVQDLATKIKIPFARIHLYIIKDNHVNILNTGNLYFKNAIECYGITTLIITTGALSKLDMSELKYIIGYELDQIKESTNLPATELLSILSPIVIIGEIMMFISHRINNNNYYGEPIIIINAICEWIWNLVQEYIDVYRNIYQNHYIKAIIAKYHIKNDDYYYHSLYLN